MTEKRLNFADLMRGLAMIVMIEVHVVNSMMNPALRNETWFSFVNFLNGMVTPCFIFISGFAFMLASDSKLDEFRKYGYVFWRQTGRIMLIWFLGYMLHIPYLSRQKCISIATSDQWMKFLGVDVLQCIAFSLLVIFIFRLLIKNDRIFILTVLLLGLGAVIPAAEIYTVNFKAYLPLFMAMYITPVYHTGFPLFPWFGFMAAGVVTARFFISSAGKGSEARFIKRILITGLIIASASVPLIFIINVTDVRPTVYFFTARLGVVFIILGFCYLYCSFREGLTPVILYSSRESLAVYFMHLQLIHREIWNGKSLITLGNHSLDFGTCLIISAGIIILMLPMAWAWNYLKTRYRYFGRTAVAVMLSAGIFIFLIR